MEGNHFDSGEFSGSTSNSSKCGSPRGVDLNTVATDEAFPTGYTFTVYDATKPVAAFTVPSENVKVTHGAMKYIEDLKERGLKTTARFVLCRNFSKDGTCRKGRACTYIHADVATEHTTFVHRPGGPYETLPPGHCFNVSGANCEFSHAVPSHELYRTAGALAACNNKKMRPRHCAHFQYKKLCNRGKNCGFLHWKGSVVALQSGGTPRPPGSPGSHGSPASPASPVTGAVVPGSPPPVPMPPYMAPQFQFQMQFLSNQEMNSNHYPSS